MNRDRNLSAEWMRLIVQRRYLNGGLFDVHHLERYDEDIHIPDEAFQRIFDFFDAYQWHLDDGPLHDDKEINPDVLGYIFEKYKFQGLIADFDEATLAARQAEMLGRYSIALAE